MRVDTVARKLLDALGHRPVYHIGYIRDTSAPLTHNVLVRSGLSVEAALAGAGFQLYNKPLFL
jgi:hypothetical protein